MAQKITVTLEDDLDGGPATETLQFSIGGTQYEIDLSKKNARAFRKQVAPFIEHAPAGLGEDSAVNRGVRSQAAGTVVTSARGRKTRASRSARGGAFRPALPNSTRPPPNILTTSGRPGLDVGERCWRPGAQTLHPDQAIWETRHGRLPGAGWCGMTRRTSGRRGRNRPRWQTTRGTRLFSQTGGMLA